MIRYAFSDGHGSYIRFDKFSGKYVPVRNESLAEQWDLRSKAQNILKNAISKQNRKKYHIVEIDDGLSLITEEPIKKNEPDKNEQVDLHIDKVKELSEDSLEENQITKWSGAIESLTGLVLDAETRRDELTVSMSDIDKEITDIQHYIELNNLNAYQGFLAYKMLQVRLRKRRKIKDELQVLTQLGNCKIESSTLIDVQNAIKEMDNRVYTPRILTQLFG